jgi:hypothetical protein
MIKFGNQTEEPSTWFSEEADWNTPDGSVIAVWEGCILKEEEYSDFISFVKKEIDSEVEPVGSFKTAEDMTVFVFLVKTNVARFSTWRFKLPGMSWWFDMFWRVNGGRSVSEIEIVPIITKLGLKINGVTQDVYDEVES